MTMATIGGLPPLIPGGIGGADVLGQELLIRYNPAPIEDHARLIIGHINGDEYIVTDPGRNWWDESLLVDGHDTLVIWVRPGIFLSPMDILCMASIFTMLMILDMLPGPLYNRCLLWSQLAKRLPTGAVLRWPSLSWRL